MRTHDSSGILCDVWGLAQELRVRLTRVRVSMRRTLGQKPRGNRLDVMFLVLLCMSFVCLGWPFLKGMGIEVDEALAGSGIYLHAAPQYSVEVAGMRIPLMILSYLGALKVWLCGPLFALWGPGVNTLRMPSLLLGALTLILFWYLLVEICGRRVAWVGTLLLATDTTFLLLTAIDFGPVAVQLLLKCAIMLLFVRWRRSGKALFFACAWFLTGLAFWDKALFLWIAAGLLCGAAVAVPHDVRAALKLRLVLIAGLSLCVGSLPLIVYNITNPLDTFTRNAKIVPEEAIAKLPALENTLNGSVLLGFYTAADAPPRPEHLRRATLMLSHITHNANTNWTFVALLSSLCCVPFLWRTSARKPILFASVSFAVSWLAMAISSGGGGAAHHIALLWPMQYLLIAVVLVEVSLRVKVPVYVPATAALVIVSLILTGRYYCDLKQNGPAIRWTRAINSLTDQLETLHPGTVFIVDWGVLESVDLLSRGELPLTFASEYTSEVTSDRTALLRDVMANPRTVFVTRTPEYEQVAGRDRLLDQFAQRAGLRSKQLALVQDGFGRSIFVISRFI